MLHTYVTQNGKVVRETIGTGSSAKVLDFIYDESGKPFALKYSTNNGSSFTTYYYVLNLQGDVVKLVTASGTAVATYTYDAWGNHLSISGSMAAINPLRYRGYYYDTETDFYYLQSRYYDPANHRFINADSYASTGQGIAGTNMFAYCNNNPSFYIDTGGNVSTINTLVADSASAPLTTADTNIVARFETDECRDFYEAKNIHAVPGFCIAITVEEGEKSFDYTNGKRIFEGTMAITNTVVGVAAHWSLLAASIGPYLFAAGIITGAYEQVDEVFHPYEDDIPNGIYDEFIVTITGYRKVWKGLGYRSEHFKYTFVYYRTSQYVSGPETTYCRSAIFEYQ